MQTHGSNGTSSDEQPTQEINLEQQSTLPMVVERQDLEQQPTQPMAVEQKNLKQQMALPRRMRIHAGSYSLPIAMFLLKCRTPGATRIQPGSILTWQRCESHLKLAHYVVCSPRHQNLH